MSDLFMRPTRTRIKKVPNCRDSHKFINQMKKYQLQFILYKEWSMKGIRGYIFTNSIFIKPLHIK